MKIVKFMALCLVTAILCGTLSSCSGFNILKYDAKLYDQAGKWIRPNFAKGNYVFMGTEPRTITLIVDTQQEYDEIFVENIDELKTDFNKQMLIVYTRVFITMNECKISKIDINDKNVHIIYDIKESPIGVPTDCSPYQRWMVIRINKTVINNVVVEEVDTLNF